MAAGARRAFVWILVQRERGLKNVDVYVDEKGVLLMWR